MSNTQGQHQPWVLREEAGCWGGWGLLAPISLLKGREPALTMSKCPGFCLWALLGLCFPGIHVHVYGLLKMQTQPAQ